MARPIESVASSRDACEPAARELESRHLLFARAVKAAVGNRTPLDTDVDLMQRSMDGPAVDCVEEEPPLTVCLGDDSMAGNSPVEAASVGGTGRPVNTGFGAVLLVEQSPGK